MNRTLKSHWRSASIAGGSRIACWIAAAILLAACGQGPSESEFVTACLKEGEIAVNKARNREMGLNSETACKCAAKEATASMSADARQSMILNMQGKKQESKAITGKMSEAEKMAAMNAALELFKKCAGSGR
jgi:hypothetical protein